MEGLKRLIDHAPLFPPASLGMGAAVAEDARARASEHSWMLARFVCPASRLTELEGAMEPDGAPALSVVLDGGDWRDTPFRVEAVEMVGVSREDLADVETFCEVQLDDEALRYALGAVAAVGAKAKVRCGGAHVPSEERLAAFIVAARAADVAWKATAGLHHPVRTEREHGFLNLLEAVGLAEEGADEAALRTVLAERDPAALRGAAERPRGRFVSIGSCSFIEPVEDLQGLGLL
ncbi:MAG TPA: hypothetical protein VEX67_16895 [Solirubrobacteraceae bacterium]|nr:hypothetical protein [Solirubrobacteraceae bacterium]